MQHDVLLIAGPFFAVVEVGTIVFRYIQLRAQLTCRRLSFLRRRNAPFGSFATSGTAIRRNARIIHLELRVVGLLLRSCATRQRARQSSGGKYPYQSHALSFQPNGVPNTAAPTFSLGINHSEPGQLPFRQPYQARNISMQENGDQSYFLRSTPSSASTKSNAASMALSIS